MRPRRLQPHAGTPHQYEAESLSDYGPALGRRRSPALGGAPLLRARGLRARIGKRSGLRLFRGLYDEPGWGLRPRAFSGPAGPALMRTATSRVNESRYSLPYQLQAGMSCGSRSATSARRAAVAWACHANLQKSSLVISDHCSEVRIHLNRIAAPAMAERHGGAAP